MATKDRYVIRITSLALHKKTLSIDDLRVKLSSLEELTIEDETPRMVSVRYPGSLDELRELVGYSTRQVLVAPIREYSLPTRPYKSIKKV